MSTYVYGITRSSHPRLPEETAGVGDPPRPVRVIAAGRLAALVSDAPPDLKPKRRELLAHQSVLAEASTAGPVLPMRFGGVSPDDDAVTAALTAHEEHYLERLGTLDGKAEYNVKATHDEEAVLQRVLIDAPELRELREANKAAGGGSHEDRLRLGELVATAVQEREPRDAALLRNALEGAAEDTCPGPPSGGWLANISFLVDREHGEEFVAAVAALRRENPHLVLRVNGPLPPYSFVE
ncbi:GvpL/GvpF family gas vesicle protein [Streptomyces sp. NPDC057654]|uniref:GvpL/GvpF family gas vesicle protein n=1 Tax=Streptomyces sp. NPDC057654 TaxID=3346196 RepID=UPI00369D5133